MSLSLKNIEDYTIKLNLTEFDFMNYKKDESGDFQEVFDPDTDFSIVRDRIMSNVLMRKKIVSKGLNNIEIFDTLWINGYKTKVATMFEKGSSGFGTTIKMIVKYVEAPIQGRVKQFLGFEPLRNYMELVSE